MGYRESRSRQYWCDGYRHQQLNVAAVLSAKAQGRLEVRVMSAIPINTVAEPFIRLDDPSFGEGALSSLLQQ